RAADCGAELVAAQRRLGQLRVPFIGVEYVVAQELKDRAVKLVGTRLGQHVDDATGKAAILRVVTVGLNTELLDGVRVGQYVGGIPQVGHVDAAVKIVVHRAGAAVGATVDQGALLRKAQNK